MEKFTEIKLKFQICAYDYLTGKSYVYHEDFNSYEEAYEAVPKIEFPSNVCGISIREVPLLDISIDGGFLNANFEG